MKLDFSEVKETVDMTDGNHEVTIVTATEKVSKNGTPLLNLSMKEESTGAVIFDNVCLSGPGAFKCQQLISALGISDEDFEGMNASDLVGYTLEITVEHREYEGEQRTSVKKYIG